MPFYEYECSNCKFYTEVMQKISDTPLTKCPSCGKSALVKLVSAPNFRLKGGGWYETDFKGDKENKRNLAGGERDESPSSESKADSTAKTESTKTETPSSESKSAPASSIAPAIMSPLRPENASRKADFICRAIGACSAKIEFMPAPVYLTVGRK